MQLLLDIGAIEAWHIKAHRQVEGRIWESKDIPWNWAQLAHLVDAEGRVDLEDGAEEDVVEDVVA